MKNFPYKYPLYIKILFGLGYALALACAVLNIYNFVRNSVARGAVDYLVLVLTVVIAVAYIVLATAMLISSSYEINEKSIVLKWGLLKNQIPLDKISKLEKHTASNKLFVYYRQSDTLDGYFVIYVKPEIYNDFVIALGEKVPNLAIDIIDDAEKTDK